MKIVLMHPPMPHMVMAFSPSFMHSNVGIQPPMGLIAIATYLKLHSSHEVHVLDTQLGNMDHDGVGRHIAGLRPDIVGIGTTTMSFYDALQSARAVKKNVPGCIVVMGGPHSSVYPQETIRHEEIDYLMEGEGEITFCNFAERIASGGSLDDIPGVYYLKDGNVVYTGPNPLISDLNTLPIPDRKLTDYTQYFSSLSKRRPVTNMMTSRGCPFQCIYCNRLGKKYRTRSAENVLAEIRECMEMGIQEITVYDDTFTIQRQRVIDICHGILKEGWDFVWNIRTRVDCVDEEMLKLLKKAGCNRIHYGIESGNPKVLRALRKGIRIDDVKQAFRLTKKAGMETYAYLMFGSPEETEREIEDTLRLVREINPDYAAFAITTPMPSTDLYKRAFDEQVYPDDHWLDYIRNPVEYFEPRVWDREISRDRLQELQIRAYKKFYSNPVRLLKKVASVKSFKELSIKSRIAVQMFLSR